MFLPALGLGIPSAPARPRRPTTSPPSKSSYTSNNPTSHPSATHLSTHRSDYIIAALPPPPSAAPSCTHLLLSATSSNKEGKRESRRRQSKHGLAGSLRRLRQVKQTESFSRAAGVGERGVERDNQSESWNTNRALN